MELSGNTVASCVVVAATLGVLIYAFAYTAMQEGARYGHGARKDTGAQHAPSADGKVHTRTIRFSIMAIVHHISSRAMRRVHSMAGLAMLTAILCELFIGLFTHEPSRLGRLLVVCTSCFMVAGFTSSFFRGRFAHLGDKAMTFQLQATDVLCYGFYTNSIYSYPRLEPPKGYELERYTTAVFTVLLWSSLSALLVFDARIHNREAYWHDTTPYFELFANRLLQLPLPLAHFWYGTPWMVELYATTQISTLVYYGSIGSMLVTSIINITFTLVAKKVFYLRQANRSVYYLLIPYTVILCAGIAYCVSIRAMIAYILLIGAGGNLLDYVSPITDEVFMRNTKGLYLDDGAQR